MSENDTLGFGGFTPPPGPPQPPKRHRFRNWVVIPVVSLLGLVLVIGIIAGLAGGGTKTAKALPTVIPTTTAPTPPVSDTAQDLTGPLGTTYINTTQDQSGNDVKYDVTAVKVLDPARGSNEFETPDHGNRFVGVKFKITGDSGYASDNANSDAIIQGSDGQTYTADFSSLSAGTNFNSGDFGVTAGRTQTGWVTFQLPKGVGVASVQWQPNSSGDQPPAIWEMS